MADIRKDPRRNSVPVETTGTPEAPKAGWATPAMAGQLIMVTPERIRQLVKTGHIDPMQNGLYLIVNVVQGYIRFLKDEERRASQNVSANRVRDVRAKEIELRIAREQKTVIDWDEHLSVVDELCGIFTSSLDALPAAVTREMAVRRKIEKEVNGIRQAIVDRALKANRELRAGGAPAQADAEDAA